METLLLRRARRWEFKERELPDSQSNDQSEKRPRFSVFSLNSLRHPAEDVFAHSFDGFAKSVIPAIDFKLDKLLPESELKSIQDSMSDVWKTLSESLSDLLDYRIDLDTSLLKRISQQAEDALKPLQFKFPEIDWSKANIGAEKWGEYGWVIPNSFSFHEVCSPPNTLQEANAYCRKRCGTGTDEFAQACRRVATNSRKKRDAEAALELFTGKQYKPCAMMLCSLIEGEIRHRGGKAARAKSPLSFAKGQVNDLRDMTASLSFAINYEATVCYFFKRTRSESSDFDMALEGELNRNILMHGMMHKPVRQQTCIKLIYLYDSTIRVVSH